MLFEQYRIRVYCILLNNNGLKKKLSLNVNESRNNCQFSKGFRDANRRG